MKKLSMATLLALAVTGRASLSDESVAPPPPLPSETQQAPAEQQSGSTSEPTEAASPAVPLGTPPLNSDAELRSGESPEEPKSVAFDEPAAEPGPTGAETAGRNPVTNPTATSTEAEVELPSAEELFGAPASGLSENEASGESSKTRAAVGPVPATSALAAPVPPASVAPASDSESSPASAGPSVRPSVDPVPQVLQEATLPATPDGPQFGGDDGSIRPPVVFESEELPVIIDDRILEPRSPDAIRTQRLIQEREARRARLRQAVLEQRKRSGISVSRPNVIDARRYGQSGGRLIYTPRGQRLTYEFRTSGR